MNNQHTTWEPTYPDYNTFEVEECLVQRMYQEEQKKPPWLRNHAFYIYCPCKRCNPFHLTVQL